MNKNQDVKGSFSRFVNPEMGQVGRTTMTIFSFPFDEPSEAKEHQVEVSLLLTKSVEPLDATVRTQGG